MILSLSIRERVLHRLHLLPTPLMDAFGSVLFGRALVLAVRAGFFETLRSGPIPVADIALATGLHPSATHLLADAFVQGGTAVPAEE